MGGFFGSRASNPISELEIIFREGGDPVQQATDWARAALSESGIDPNKKPVAATKVLRDKEPALKLEVAAYLIKKIRQST